MNGKVILPSSRIPILIMSVSSSGSSEAFGERLKSWLRRKAINDGRYDHFKNLEREY